MKKLMILAALMIFSALPMQANAENAKPILYAVAFHADWCGGCKMLAPNMVKARGKSDLDNQNVLFIKLDLTDKATRHQASLMASALGLADLYKSNNGKTGFILLINSKTNKPVGKITKDMDANLIATTIEGQIKAL